MPCPLTLQDLDPRDALVMWDLIRFGALADYQVDRRYGGSDITRARLTYMLEQGLVTGSTNRLQDITVYEPTERGYFLCRFGLKRRKVRDWHTAHDIAVVDLADYLQSQYPTGTVRAENQIFRELDCAVEFQKIARPDIKRTPDGLLVVDGKRIGIELEHSIKSTSSYEKICRWYALEVRVHQIWWFTDDPAIEARIRQVNQDFDYAEDTHVRYEPFPPGVVIRPRVK